ncbi:MAG: hypothetical protein IJ258_05750 [Methanobrevibacter sp.]|uniref:hypothetical protein n=1 Tax=Methanobrevibacter sp. TaxID=66852 RepID=UPI0025DE90E8|nr:hypothetical protein [Methanobrevibacter sp.]MBQ8017596.1 hypothetical protein [Methanobrevibacter sp.]
MNTNDITPTKGRLKQALDNAVTNRALPQITHQIETTVDEEKIRTGRVLKFYHYLDKALVELDNTDETVLCKILHRFGGELIDLYTPSADSIEYCDDLHEPCIIPRCSLNCLIINIHDNDSEEFLLLGFYQNEELVELNPAAPGNFKIVSIGGTNQFWIKFGADGLDLRLPNTATTNVGDMDKNMEEVDYADSTNVYTKQEVYNKTEVYTKEEVDELISKAIAEALGDE